MAFKALPSPEVLRQLLRYEPETGKLFWRERDPSVFVGASAWNGRLSGKEAFTALDSKGYRRGCIFNSSYAAHRIIWTLWHGCPPPDQIDHINGDRQDNSLRNLRAATPSENMRNKRRSRTNSSGRTGVSWSKSAGAWIATIAAGGLQVHLGTFCVYGDAVAARESAEGRLNYHPNHDRQK